MSLLNSLKTGMLVTTREGITYIVLENPYMDGSVMQKRIALEIGNNKKDLSWLIISNEYYTDDLLDVDGEDDYDICIIEDSMKNSYATLQGGNILYFNSDIALTPLEKDYLKIARWNDFKTIELQDDNLYLVADFKFGNVEKVPLISLTMKWLKRFACNRSIDIDDLLNGAYNIKID